MLDCCSIWSSSRRPYTHPDRTSPPSCSSNFHFSYLQYMELVALGYLGKSLPFRHGGVAARGGTRRLLWAGALGIVPISGLWLVDQSFWYLAFVQLLAGMLWAGYQLAMAMVLLEAIPRQQRIVLLTLYNLGNSTAMVLGGLFGAALLAFFGASSPAYLMLFGLCPTRGC